MKFNSKFRNLFSKDAIKKDEVIIKEGTATVGKRTNIEGIKGDAVLLRLNGKGKIDQLQVLYSKFLKICDYILLTLTDNSFYVIFIELKTTFKGEIEPYEQLLRSRPLLDYFLSIYAIEYEKNAKPVLKPKIRYVLLCEKTSERLDKQRVKTVPFHRKTKPYGPIRIRQFLGSYVSFSDLVKQ